MHSCETLPAQPATGASLLLELGRLIVRARSASPSRPSPAPARDRLLHARALAAKPSTSQQILTQPKPDTDEPKPGLEAHLSDHVQALWNEQIPVCIEVLLAPDCPECHLRMARAEEEGFEKLHHHQRGLLLERWTMRALDAKSLEGVGMSPQWVLNAVRSQLHFSQLGAWRATLHGRQHAHRRRKLSRETCNYKKLEAIRNTETNEQQRKLNIVYSIKRPGDNTAEFSRPPVEHKFPITDIGNGTHLQVVLQSLPRTQEIPLVPCACAGHKRRNSKDLPNAVHDELIGKLNDLTLGTKVKLVTNFDKVLDDRLLTPCCENGKHKCSYDDDIDCKDQAPKKLDERRAKEIAKYKRRLRKESKYRKICDSTSSEGDVKGKETHTSIPILQASRFDRFRAIGCYRNQTYLTLPASRIETKSPFIDTEAAPPAEFKKTNTVGTQTEDLTCNCGAKFQFKCHSCEKRMVRSEANYNLASIDRKEDNGARRKCEEDEKAFKKLKCDNNSSHSDVITDLIKRPKLRRFFPITEKIDQVLSDRKLKDIEELNLDTNDTVFSVPEERKRQKTYSVGEEDCVVYEKCDYGTIDKCDEMNSVDQESGFRFPDPVKPETIPSPSEMDKFRWRFDSAASMVFHTSTGLPLTSSPAPLRRGNSCFGYDDSINGISGIKSALFHPIAPASPVPPSSPVSPASPAVLKHSSPASPTSPVPHKKETTPKLRIGPSTCLLGSFEESALKGRLEPVATVAGFSAELGASGALCPPHRRLPVTVFFYAPGGTNAPYMGHINLGPGGYRVSKSGTVQVSLFNPHGTLVKMFVVLYDLRAMPPRAKTFLRQRTLYMPVRQAEGEGQGGDLAPPTRHLHRWLRYLIHLRFMTSKSGKLYLHTDIRIIVSRKADLDTATAHSAIFRPIPTNKSKEAIENGKATNQNGVKAEPTNLNGEGVAAANGTVERGVGFPNSPERVTKAAEAVAGKAERAPNRVFGGCGDFESDFRREIGYEEQDGVPYELRSFTFAPDNPKYSPR